MHHTALHRATVLCTAVFASSLAGYTCTCPNGGIAAVGNACPTNNANVCAACTGEFFLNGQSCDAWAPACTSGQIETQVPSTTQDRVCSGLCCWQRLRLCHTIIISLHRIAPHYTTKHLATPMQARTHCTTPHCTAGLLGGPAQCTAPLLRWNMPDEPKRS